MNLKEKVEELVKKIVSDKALRAKFDKNPAAVLEELLGVELPDEQVNQLVDAVKAKITLNSVGGMLGGLFGKK